MKHGLCFRSLLLLMLFPACALTPQKVDLRPNVQAYSGGTISGGDRRVTMTIVDERPSSRVGTRGISGMGAEITTTQDVPSVIQTAVREGLQRQGFSLITDKTADGRELRIELRTLEYAVTPGIVMGTLRASSAMKGICILGNSRPYEKLYRGEHEESILVVQFASQNERYINDALSQAIQSLVQDHELIRCLAQ